MAQKTTAAGITPRPHRVAVLAFDGVVLGDLATPCQIFGLAEGYQVRVCGVKERARTQFFTMEVPWRLSSVERADTVVVPGVEDLDVVVDEAIVRALKRAVKRGARVASICTGAFVLARTGALDGRVATTHWKAAGELARRHPQISVDPAVLYVDHGQVLTSAGAAAGMDLCLHLVRKDRGAEVAAQVARAAVMPLERAGGQAQFIVPETPAEDGTTMSLLTTWLEQNLRRPLSLPVMARRAGMSARTLSRRFRAEVGATPAAWLANARVRRCQRLLETTSLSVERLAAEVGFGSAAVLRQHFVEVVGTSPQAYRKTFRARQ